MDNKKYDPNLPEHLILDLPDWSQASEQPEISLIEIISLCEKMLPIWNKERSKEPPPPLPEGEFSL